MTTKRCSECRYRKRGKHHEDGPHHQGRVIKVGSPKMRDHNLGKIQAKEKKLEG